jgi:hypothetical protein
MKTLQLFFSIIIFSFLIDFNKARNNHAKEGYYEIKKIGTLVVKELQLKMDWSKFEGTLNTKLLKLEVK